MINSLALARGEREPLLSNNTVVMSVDPLVKLVSTFGDGWNSHFVGHEGGLLLEKQSLVVGIFFIL